MEKHYSIYCIQATLDGMDDYHDKCRGMCETGSGISLCNCLCHRGPTVKCGKCRRRFANQKDLRAHKFRYHAY